MATDSHQALTPDEVESIRLEAVAVVASEFASQSAAARDSGIKYGTFTGWLSGKYQGDNARVAGDVRIWLASRAERRRAAAALPQAPTFVPTKTARRISEVLQWAQIGPDMVVAAGGAGIGKSTVCEHYAAVNPNVWLATMQPSTATVHTMLQSVAAAVGVTERSATKLSEAIGTRVQDTGGLLIVDEAQHLSSKALDQLRALHDLFGIGIALVGNESVYGRLQGEGRKPEFAQLFSRVGMRFTRPRPYGDDICALIDAWQVSDANARSLLKAIAGKPGALRGLTKTLRLATMLARGADEALAEKHVKAAYARLSDNGADRAEAA